MLRYIALSITLVVGASDVERRRVSGFPLPSIARIAPAPTRWRVNADADTGKGLPDLSSLSSTSRHRGRLNDGASARSVGEFLLVTQLLASPNAPA